MRLILALFLCSLLPLRFAWGDDITLLIGKHSIRATVANTPSSRELGLMRQTQLCKNCGMLFVFPEVGPHRFWMKHTPLSLSIAFIATDGSILNIAEMHANSTDHHSAQGNALYALEMNKAWFTENNIKPREYVRGLNKATKGQ